MVRRVALEHDAVLKRHAVLRHHGGEVRLGGFGVIEHHQHLAAARQIGKQRVALGFGNVALRRVDDHHIRVVGYGFFGQQRERGKSIMLAFRVLPQAARQVAFAVSGEHIGFGQVVAGHIVDGGGQRAFARKLGGGAARRVVAYVIGDVDIRIADILAAVARNDNQAVVIQRGTRVLARKIRIDDGVFLFDPQAVGQPDVSVEQFPERVVLRTGLHNPVDRHVRIQRADELLGLRAQGEQAACRRIQMGVGRGQRARKQVHRNGNRNHDDNRRRGIAARAEAAAHQPRFQAEAFLF